MQPPRGPHKALVLYPLSVIPPPAPQCGRTSKMAPSGEGPEQTVRADFKAEHTGWHDRRPNFKAVWPKSWVELTLPPFLPSFLPLSCSKPF